MSTTVRAAMSAMQTSPIAIRRGRWRSYLVLSRISNLPTVWTNVLAGMCLSSAIVSTDVFFRVGLAISLFYMGGMFLNDAFDAPFDTCRISDRHLWANPSCCLLQEPKGRFWSFVRPAGAHREVDGFNPA